MKWSMMYTSIEWVIYIAEYYQEKVVLNMRKNLLKRTALIAD